MYSQTPGRCCVRSRAQASITQSQPRGTLGPRRLPIMPRTGSCCFLVVTLPSALSLFTRHREENGADGPAQTPIRRCSYGCCRRGWVLVPVTRSHRLDGFLCSERPNSRPWPRSLREGRSSLSTLPGLGPVRRSHWLHVLSLPGAGQWVVGAGAQLDLVDPEVPPGCGAVGRKGGVWWALRDLGRPTGWSWVCCRVHVVVGRRTGSVT